jgi:hypothetical protein
MRTRDEYRIVGILGDLPMRLLVICALVVGVGSLVLIGLWALVRELFSDSIFGVPSVSDEQARRARADQPQSSSSSATAIPQYIGADGVRPWEDAR